MTVSYAKLFAAACGLASTAQAVHPLIVEGKDFVNSVTKDRFQIIGVDYQPGGSAGFKKGSDPLSDKDTCLRDAAVLQLLGVNAIRVYNLSPSANHDDCASIFNAAGIYLFLDVNSPLTNGALDQTAPWTTYNHFYMQQVFGVIEAFKGYPNTAAFFSANEVINEKSVEQAGNYIRAVQRDMHDYIEKHAKRTIPVGYSAADVRPLLVDTAYYLSCDLSNSTSSRSDFFGLNSYSWCGDATYKSSGYNVLTEDFKNISLPVFFSETGCNNVKPRVFSEIEAIYGPDMSQSLSGALVYEYSQEENDYGLVKINGNGSISLRTDFNNLQAQYNKLDLGAITKANSTQTSMNAPSCNPDNISSNITKSFDVPKRVDGIDKLVEDGYTKNVHVGQLVDVTTTKVSQDVFDSNGNLISNIKLNILSDDAVNAPGNNTVSGGTSTSTGSSPSGTNSGSAAATSSGAASTLTAGSMTGFGGLVALALMAL